MNRPTLPRLNYPGAYERLRRLQRNRRRAGLVALALFVAVLLTLALYSVLPDAWRYTIRV